MQAIPHFFKVPHYFVYLPKFPYNNKIKFLIAEPL